MVKLDVVCVMFGLSGRCWAGDRRETGLLLACCFLLKKRMINFSIPPSLSSFPPSLPP